jgi:2',3'-cyclic-nucleotide 2'-phosphodiesterase/3'-nucleotidase
VKGLLQIDVLGHADFSARFKKNRDCPGFAAFGTHIERIRRKNPEGTLLLDAGDGLCSKFWSGEQVLQALALLKTDAMTLGNHEFDRGRAFLETCVEQAAFPVLCANITEEASGRFVKGVRPWVMLKKQGVLIGVLGLTTEYTPNMVTAAAFAGYTVHASVEICKKYIPEMRGAGAQIVVVLSHFPFYVDADGGISGELYDVLTQIPHVDAFIGGHIPGDYAGIVNGTAVVKGGFGGNSLPHIRLWYDAEKGGVVRKECTVHPVDRNTETDERYRSYEERIVAPIRDYLDTVLAVADERWEIRLAHETKLGNLLADSLREGADTQIAYMNATSSCGSVEPGPVTIEDMTSVLGFNDPVCKTQMTGRQLWELFEMVYVPERFGNNAGLLFSGVIVEVDHTRPANQKIRSLTLRDGTPVEMDQTYSVAASDYMASGGNDTSALTKKLTWEKTQTRLYDMLFAYLRKYGTMHVSPEQRLIETGEPENNHAPF